MKKRLIVGVAVVAISVCIQASGWCQAPTKFDPNDPDITAIKTRLLSGDSNQVSQAVASIRRYFEANPNEASLRLVRDWNSPLFLAHRYEDAAALGLAAALACFIDGSQGGLEEALAMRVRALIKLDRCDEALEVAKSLYNVCQMRNTSTAVDLVGDALTCARKNDPGVARRFRLEQLAAANTNSNVAVATKEPTIMASIKINGDPYKPAIERLMRDETLSAVTLTSLGSAYLVVDQPKRAEEMFQEAYARAPSAWAAEGIARSIRAQDGNVHRANAWVLEQRAKTQ